MFNKFKTIHQIMEELKKNNDELYLDVSRDESKCLEDGMIRRNFGLKANGRHLTFWNEVGCICGEFNGYVPLNGGTVVYM